MMNFKGNDLIFLSTAEWRELVEREGVRVPSWERAWTVNYTRKNPGIGNVWKENGGKRTGRSISEWVSFFPFYSWNYSVQFIASYRISLS